MGKTTGMELGYGAPFINIFFNGQLMIDHCEKFTYISAEDKGDSCDITLVFDQRNIPDLPQYQERAAWTVLWGLLGGNKSRKRKVYINEVKWEFSDQDVKGTFKLLPKAQTTKQVATAKVYENTSIVDVLHDVGVRHGLLTYVELPGEYKVGTDSPNKKGILSPVFNDGDDFSFIDKATQLKRINSQPIKVLTTDEMVSAIKDAAKRKSDSDSTDISLFGSTTQDLIDEQGVFGAEGGAFSVSGTVIDRNNLKNMIQSFDLYGNIAQGNKTDKQLLDELAKRQPNGPYVVDADDDDLTLKRRNFDKKPYRAYEYGVDGELLQFTHESKSRSKDGTSVNMNFGGWDKNNKTYFNGDANALNDNQSKTLAKYQKDLEVLNALPDQKVVDFTKISKEFNLAYDGTNVVKPNITIPIRVLDKKAIVTGQINSLLDPTGQNAVLNDPTTGSPAEGFQNAANARDEAELKNNPGSADLVLDPLIEKGMVITFKGVSKKYSGNYYVTEAKHEINGKDDAMLTIEIVRQGHNIRTNSSYKGAKEIGKTTNTETGSDDGDSTKTLTTRSNKKHHHIKHHHK